MRLLAASLICVGVLGGMAAYMHAVAQRQIGSTYDKPAAAGGVYAIEITPSYDIGAKDPFALDLGDEAPPQSLSVRLAEQELFAATEMLAAGQPVRIEPIVGLVQGKNELFVTARVSGQQSQRSNALRVRVFRDQVELSDQTLWSDSGGAMSGKIQVDIDSLPPQEVAHEHD